MRFTQDPSSGINIIRGYSEGQIRINENTYTETLIVSASALIAASDIRDASELIENGAPRILALEPDLILLGTGPRQIFPPASFGAQFLQAGIGFEVMDTSAACRTFNVLVAEQRPVVAVLLLR